MAASVIKGDVLRVDGMPFITRLPGLPELPRGQRLELDVLGTNEIDLVMEARVHQVLAAQALTDLDDEEVAEEEVEIAPDSPAAPEPPPIDEGTDLAPPDPGEAAASSDGTR